MFEAALHLFEPYWKKRDLTLLKRECDQLKRVLGEFLEEVVDGIWSIYFKQLLLGRIDEREMILRG